MSDCCFRLGLVLRMTSQKGGAGGVIRRAAQLSSLGFLFSSATTEGNWLLFLSEAAVKIQKRLKSSFSYCYHSVCFHFQSMFPMLNFHDVTIILQLKGNLAMRLNKPVCAAGDSNVWGEGDLLVPSSMLSSYIPLRIKAEKGTDQSYSCSAEATNYIHMKSDERIKARKEKRSEK